jgi:V/A-type H+-transporting ATPase subunit C
MFDFLRQEYAAARLRAMKGKLIDRAKFSKLVKARSFSEIANNLENTDYEAVFYHGLEKDILGIENELDKIFVGILEKIKRFYYGRERRILDVFLKEWEIKNLKILVKSVVSGEDWSGSLVPVEGFDLEGLAKSGDVENLTNGLKDTDYYEPIYSGYSKIDQFGTSIVDFYLELSYVRMFLSVAKEAKDKEILHSYLKTRNDLLNLRNILRSIIFKKDLSEFFIEPTNVRKEWFRLGSAEALLEKLKSEKFGIKNLTSLEDDTAFELAMGKNLEKIVSDFLMISPFDTGLLLYYLITKRNEINRLKVITRFVKEDLDREDLKMLVGVEE